MKSKSAPRLFMRAANGDLKPPELIFRHLQIQGPLSRGKLAKLTGLSPRQVGSVLDHLHQRGLIKLAPNRTWLVARAVPMPPRKEMPSKLDVGVDDEHLEWMKKYRAQGLARRARVTP